MLAVALGSLLLFSVLAFATTEQWSLSTFQVGTFILGIWCAGRRSLRWHPLGFALAGVVALAAIQLWVGATVYRFATANALVNWTAYFVLFIVSLEALADSDILKAWAASGMAPYPKELRTPSGAAGYLRSEIERWGQVVRDNKIEAPTN